jgi:ferredoxin--NADP+ reductase
LSIILKKSELAPGTYEMVIRAPTVGPKAQPGHFVIVMAEEKGERIPLTVADYDRDNKTVTIVIKVAGASTMKLVAMQEGQRLHAFLGPLGNPSEIEDFGTVVVVAGGVGTAPIYPIARALREKGNRIIAIQGAASKDLLFWQDKLASVSDEQITTTDDGSLGKRAFVTEPLKEVLENDKDGRIGCVYAIGPAIMMKVCSNITRPFGVKTVVSLNSIMVDGTGMCGGCRVNVGGQTLFTCVDGPEFDGHLVDWDLLMSRQKIYDTEEQCSLDDHVRKAGKG